MYVFCLNQSQKSLHYPPLLPLFNVAFSLALVFIHLVELSSGRGGSHDRAGRCFNKVTLIVASYSANLEDIRFLLTVICDLLTSCLQHK